MFQSVRARLALWHTAVLAVLLTGFALAAYIFLERSTAARAEDYLASAAAGFVTDLAAEVSEQGGRRPRQCLPWPSPWDSRALWACSLATTPQERRRASIQFRRSATNNVCGEPRRDDQQPYRSRLRTIVNVSGIVVSGAICTVSVRAS